MVRVPDQIDLLLHLPEQQNYSINLFSPESIRSSLFNNWFIPLVLEGFGVEHVEEVKLDVYRNWRPFPRLVGSGTLPYYQLLEIFGEIRILKMVIYN